jgi:competence protein ComEC
MGDGIKMFLAKIQSNVYKEIITTTLAAYLATLPYTLYTFGTISLYALFANVIVLPLVPLMMLVTFLTVVTAPLVEMVGMFFGYITTLLGSFIIFIARLFEGLPFSSVRFEISLLGMVLVYSSLIASFIFFVVRQKNKRDETDATGKNEILSGIISY